MTLELFDHGSHPSDCQLYRWATSCRDVKYALMLLAELNVDQVVALLVDLLHPTNANHVHAERRAAFEGGLLALAMAGLPVSITRNVARA
jgi:hypothetical protein